MASRQTDSSLSQRLILWAHFFWFEEESDASPVVEIHGEELTQLPLPTPILTAAFG
jgi:hypothetical protein